MSEELISRLRQAIQNYNVEEAEKIAKEAAETKIDPIKAIEGLTEAIKEVGERFHRYEIFLPHVVLASDAMNAAVKILKPLIPKGKEIAKKGKIVIGTVEGDEHEIGKNIVAMVLKAKGFEVYDLDVEVKSETFIEYAKEIGSDIIAQSALMTTTMPFMKNLLDDLKALQLRDKFKIMIGGGPVTREWANQIGADGYGKNAHEAVNEAKKLVDVKSRLRENL